MKVTGAVITEAGGFQTRRYEYVGRSILITIFHANCGRPPMYERLCVTVG